MARIFHSSSLLMLHEKRTSGFTSVRLIDRESDYYYYYYYYYCCCTITLFKFNNNNNNDTEIDYYYYYYYYCTIILFKFNNNNNNDTEIDDDDDYYYYYCTIILFKFNSSCDRRSVGQFIFVSGPHSRPTTRYYFLSECCCLKFAVLYLLGALSEERTGLQFAV
jgi:hypothetical protein